MNKKVCMFVWNHFTNDARVLRECTALSESGYKVDLICIHDPKDNDLPVFEERDANFSVYRVRRYPMLLELMQKVYRKSLRDKFFGLILFLIWLFLMYLGPIITGIVTVIGLLLLKTKLKVLWIRGSILFRMIAKGFQKNYDIYHSNDLNTLPQGYLCSKIRIRKKRLIYDSHEVQTSRTGYDTKYYGLLEHFLIKKIDDMIVENHTRAKYNQDFYGFYPYVVHNYPFIQKDKHIKKAPLHSILNLPPSEKILLYQGGIQAGRGLEKLIKAVPLFKEGTLVLIGDGRIKPALETLVEEMDLKARVKFLPKVPLQDLPSYTSNAYLGFQVLNNTNFNHYSASSNKLFEYMMAGVPVVACSFPEIMKVVEGEKVGLCVDSHDSSSIALGVNELIENIELHQEMVKNTKTAKLKYNWGTEKVNLLEVYSS
ncbi:glycosyltransferase [Sediminibacillus albus]|uniref:Glycosyltransferase involved in cell wall bisynthesis n=1 Tax=Sediminibacillus albus TaxID=407036 RepID=A0A1G8ZFJ9_9BACI|nr:glycosyltransferase [Sediminibacillus albus]SDK13788.1 Glycosyltransferase involved in cell wall bisynthesis [Sediminibacillus albus]